MPISGVPSCSDFFKAQYYSNTYLPAVDLSDAALKEDMLENASKEPLKELISEPHVQPILSEPLTYDEVKARKNGHILEAHGFKMLGLKPSTRGGGFYPFYSVIEHSAWECVIKAGAARTSEEELGAAGYNDLKEVVLIEKEDSLFRISMAKRIKKIAEQQGIEVTIPWKKLVAYENATSIQDPTKKYCIICQKMDVLYRRQVIERIGEMDAGAQRLLANRIVVLIRKAGLVDADFNNIRLDYSNKITFIDTEPCGLMVKKTAGLFQRQGISIEKAARLGLYKLLNDIPESEKLKPFSNAINEAYRESTRPKFSKWKITLAIATLGLALLINAVVACVKHLISKHYYALMKQGVSKTAEKAYYLSIEGVPCTPAADG